MESVNTNVLKALNGTSNSNDKAILANEIEHIKDTLFSLVNDLTGGEYLFSGNNTDTIPFVKDDVTVQIVIKVIIQIRQLMLKKINILFKVLME